MAVVKMLPPALKDLERLVAFLRDEDPQAAADTARIIFDALRILEKYPLIGRLIEHDRRELVIYRGRTGYLAQYHYEPGSEEVLVVALRHQREMEEPVNIHEAKTHLSRLIERVQAGEEIVIAKAGRPAARLVPIEGARRPVKIGGLKPAASVPDDFNTMFESDIEALFAGMPSAKGRKRK